MRHLIDVNMGLLDSIAWALTMDTGTAHPIAANNRAADGADGTEYWNRGPQPQGRPPWLTMVLLEPSLDRWIAEF